MVYAEGGVLNTREKAFEKAMQRRNEYTPKLEEFFNVPGFYHEKIENDIRFTTRKKGTFDTARYTVEQAKRAGVLEVILAENIELSNWLGERVETVFASEYDDLANGVDFAIMLAGLQESAPRYLAVDVTFSQQQVVSKLRKIKEKIDSGDLTRIEYCQDSEGEKYSPGQVPQCILLFDETETDHLTRLWVEKRKRELEHHPFQFALVEQLGCQLLMFEQYAKRIGNTELEKKFLDMRRSLALGLVADRDQNDARKQSTTVTVLRNTLSDVFGLRCTFPNGFRSFTEWAYSLDELVVSESV